MLHNKIRLAVVCASNQNRSMEAHDVLSKNGFQVQSFGTGSQVKLPGSAADKPNIYPFGTPYDAIYEELQAKDARLYTRNGVLSMLDRNRRIKRAPERFRDAKDKFDLIICCEERCFDQVLEDLGARETDDGTPVHILNLDIKDNHDDASVGAQHILQLCRMLFDSDDLDDDIQQKVEEFEAATSVPCLHTVAFY